MKTILELNHLEETINNALERACVDDQFKKQLVDAPKETLEQFIGKEIILKEGMTIRAIDQTNPKTLFLNILPKKTLESIELNEEQLEAIAGGAPARTETKENPIIEWFKDLFDI